MMDEVHAVDPSHQSRRDADHRDDGQNLHQIVLGDIDQPQHGIEHELHLVGQMRDEFVQRADILSDRLQPRGHAFWHPVGRGPDIGDDAADPELRIPYLGDRIVKPPQCRDHGAQLALLLAPSRTFLLAGGIELQMENMV